MVRLLLLLLVLFGPVDAALAASDRLVRFGLTAVVVRENLSFFSRWAEYLSSRVGYPVRFVQRRSYREIMQLLEKGELDVAWICGYPFVRDRDPKFLELLAVPVFQGAPLYRSYIIVHRDSPYRLLEQLRGRVFAFSDPDSNSGYLVPRLLVTRGGGDPRRYFRLSFFTFSHAETVEAVADRVADGGAVESYVWEFLRRTRPELTSQTRVILQSETFGFPPLVVHAGLERELRDRLATAITGMSESADGRRLLGELALDRFGLFSPDLYDSIRDAAASLEKSLSRAGLTAATSVAVPR